MAGGWLAGLPLYRGGSAHGPNVKSRGWSARNVKIRHVAIPCPYGLKRLAPCCPSGTLRQCPDQGWQAVHRPVGTYLATGQALSLCAYLHGKDTTGLFPAICLTPTFCPSVTFSLCRTLPRHGLREGAFLTSVGTRVRPYRTLGERPVALHPRSYRTLGCVPCGVTGMVSPETVGEANVP